MRTLALVTMFAAVACLPGAASGDPTDPVSTCVAETQSTDSAITQCLMQRAARLEKNIRARFQDRIQSARDNKDFFDEGGRAEWTRNLRKLEAAYFEFQTLDCKSIGLWTVGGPAQRQDYLSCLIQRHLAELARLSNPDN